MSHVTRKTVTFFEDVVNEGGRPHSPVRLAGIAAVIVNPWAGRGYVEDLKSEIKELAPPLAESLVPGLLGLFDGPESIEAFGKAAIVGVNGELEHASALIHTLRFGNLFRDAVGGKSFLSFSNVRGPAGAQITIPLVHKNDSGIRSHYWTLQYSIADAPAPDELVIAIGAASGGRPHARIGDRYEDMKELAAG